MKTNGNTILITGGATGIGYALASRFLKEDNEVIIVGRREERLWEAKHRNPALNIKVCDITKPDSRQELFEFIKINFPNLNILINNAGIQKDVDFTKGLTDLENGDNEIVINLEAPVFLTAQFMPLLLNNKEAAIVNVSSGLAFYPAPGTPVYCAAKAGMHMFSVTLRKQLECSGLKVFEAVPPFIPDTELNLEGRSKRPRQGLNANAPKAAEYAQAVIKGMAADQFEIGYGMSERWLNK